MSTLTDLLRLMPEAEVFEAPAVEPESAHAAESWNAESFAQEQIGLLVRQVFFRGCAKSVRHVVFSAVDEGSYIAEICMDVAKALAAQVPGSVCVIEANAHHPELEFVFGEKRPKPLPSDGFGFLRSSSQHISGGLWLAPGHLLFGNTETGKSPSWIERRLSDFRLEFDYTVLHAPPAGKYGEATWLGRLSDGVALVVEANSTRKVAAQKTKERLQAANARLLGTVLSERRFPIPEEIYRRL